MARRLLLPAGILGALIAAGVVAYAAFVALKSPLITGPSSSAATENCSPGPCANLNGFDLWVSNVHLDNNLVRMTVKFKNTSSATHVSPEDLQLIDAARHASTPATDAAGCNTWTRHEFSKSGDTFGPIDICFPVTDTAQPFILRWSPDEGAFCCETDLKLSAS